MYEVFTGSGVLLGVSSNAKQSVNDCCFEHWLLEAHRVAPHSRRGGAVGTPPSRLSPIPPPRFSAVCGFARKVRCFAYLWPKFPKLNALRGTSPPHPLVSLATPREQGDGAKSARLTTCPAAECVLLAGRQGVSKKIYKDDEAVFTNLSGRPPPALIKVTGAKRLGQPMRL